MIQTTLTTTQPGDISFGNNTWSGDAVGSGYCQTIYPYTPWPYVQQYTTYVWPPDNSARVAELEGQVKKLEGQVETLVALLSAALGKAAVTPKRRRRKS